MTTPPDNSARGGGGDFPSRKETLRILEEEQEGLLAANLQATISGWRGAPKTPPHVKLHYAERATLEAVEKLGQFHVTPEEILYWFRHRDRTLYELPLRIQDADAFVRVLARLSGVNPEDQWMRRLYAFLRVRGPEKALKSYVHRLAFWDGERLYLDRFDGTVYRLDGQRVESVPNGTDGVLFLPEPNTEPYVADLDVNRDLFRQKVCGLVRSDKERGLTQAAAEALLEAWVLASYFRTVQPTRPILCLWGEKGTTKTTTGRALGRTLLGRDFDVITLTRHKEDAFQARVTQSGLAVFDNADGKIVWLPDALATLATGARVDRRQLYRTILLVSYPIQAWAVITSRDPQFGRDDVAERLLLIPTARPPEFKREGEIQANLLRERGRLWGSLIQRLQECVRRLQENGMDFASDFRMADFAAFLLAIQEDEAAQEEARKLLRTQTSLQNEFIAETTAELWLSYLMEVLEDSPMLGVTAGEIVKRIAARAKADNVPLQLGAQTVGSTLKNAGPNLRAMGLTVSHRLLTGRRVYDLSLAGEGDGRRPSKLVMEQIREAAADWIPRQAVEVAVGKDSGPWIDWCLTNGNLMEKGDQVRWVR